MVTYKIFHPALGWLSQLAFGGSADSQAEWAERPGQACSLDLPIAVAFMALNEQARQSILVPEVDGAAELFDQGKDQKIELGNTQWEWLRQRLIPRWNGAGNCYCWFVEVAGQKHGPISPQQYGEGFTHSGDDTCYESVMGAAAALLGDKMLRPGEFMATLRVVKVEGNQVSVTVLGYDLDEPLHINLADIRANVPAYRPSPDDRLIAAFDEDGNQVRHFALAPNNPALIQS
jgi:hypothetical protein